MGCCTDPENGSKSYIVIQGCTDIFWLLLYLSLWIFLILVAAFALVYGNPKRLVHGYDSFGNTCGAKNGNMSGLKLSGLDMSNKPYVFYLDVTDIQKSLQICVESCPDQQIKNLEELRAYITKTGNNICRYDFNVLDTNNEDIEHGLNELLTVSSPLGPCPTLPVHQSISVLNRCIPSDITTSINNYLKSWDEGEQFLSTVYSIWHLIIGFSFLSLVSSLWVVSLFYSLARFVGIIILIGVSLISIAGTIILWWVYYDLKENGPSTVSFLEDIITDERAFLIYAVSATVITIMILLMVWILRSRVSFLGTLFKESADCLGALPGLHFVPICSFILLMIFYLFWIYVIVCLASARYPGTEEIRPFANIPMHDTVTHYHINGETDLNPSQNLNVTFHTIKTFTRVEFIESTWLRYMWWLYIVGLVWVSEFVLACQQIIIAGAVATWYFNGQQTVSRCHVWISVKQLIYYHLGTAALGSLLITIFKIPRLLLSFIYTRLKQKDDEKCCIQCGLKTCCCCFYCFEKFVRYINHNAYTVVVMQGINFCDAANRAWEVLAGNPLQLAVYNKIGDLILFLGKILITAFTGSVAVIIFKTQTNLHTYAVPTLIICVFAFFISHCVISVYEIIIDTLYLCICEDEDINGENGLWKRSALANLKYVSPKKESSEGSPMNTT